MKKPYLWVVETRLKGSRSYKWTPFPHVFPTRKVARQAAKQLKQRDFLADLCYYKAVKYVREGE